MSEVLHIQIENIPPESFSNMQRRWKKRCGRSEQGLFVMEAGRRLQLCKQRPSEMSQVAPRISKRHCSVTSRSTGSEEI